MPSPLKKSTNFSAEFPSDLLIVARTFAVTRAIAYLALVAREEFCGYAATINRIDDAPPSRIFDIVYDASYTIDRLLFYTSRSGHHRGVAARTARLACNADDR